MNTIIYPGDAQAARDSLVAAVDGLYKCQKELNLLKGFTPNIVDTLAHYGLLVPPLDSKYKWYDAIWWYRHRATVEPILLKEKPLLCLPHSIKGWWRRRSTPPLPPLYVTLTQAQLNALYHPHGK